MDDQPRSRITIIKRKGKEKEKKKKEDPEDRRRHWPTGSCILTSALTKDATPIPSKARRRSANYTYQDGIRLSFSAYLYRLRTTRGAICS